MSDELNRIPTDDQIADLRSLMFSAARDLKEATAVYHAAMCKAHKWQPGDIICSTNGEQALITGLSVQHNRVCVLAKIKKKDGSWGLREAPMWRREWEKATLVGREP